MARSLTANMITEVTASVLRPFIAVEIEFEQGTTRAWSGIGTITIDGNSYLGVGTLASISSIDESTENKASGIQINLTGIPSDLVSTVLQENYQGNDCKVYIGALNEVNVVITDPYLIFSGIIDTMNLTEDADQATIKLTVENRLLDLERTRIRRYTDEDQKLDFTGDVGFEYVGEIQDKELLWGINSG